MARPSKLDVNSFVSFVRPRQVFSIYPEYGCISNQIQLKCDNKLAEKIVEEILIISSEDEKCSETTSEFSKSQFNLIKTTNITCAFMFSGSSMEFELNLTDDHNDNYGATAAAASAAVKMQQDSMPNIKLLLTPLSFEKLNNTASQRRLMQSNFKPYCLLNYTVDCATNKDEYLLELRSDNFSVKLWFNKQEFESLKTHKELLANFTNSSKLISKPIAMAKILKAKKPPKSMEKLLAKKPNIKHYFLSSLT